jgi:hypothetical protein
VFAAPPVADSKYATAHFELTQLAVDVCYAEILALTLMAAFGRSPALTRFDRAAAVQPSATIEV